MKSQLCTFYKCIKPDVDDDVTKKRMNYYHINTMKPFHFFSNNEIHISQTYILKITNYFLYFAPIIKHSKVILSEIDDIDFNTDYNHSSANSSANSNTNSASKILLTTSYYSNNITSFFQMFYNEDLDRKKNHRLVYIKNVIHSYKYLLNTLQIMNSIQLVHLNIIPNNISFNAHKNPILSNFSNSFHLPQMNEERISNLFKSYSLSINSNAFYTHPLEVYIISYLANTKSNSLSHINIENICNEFVKCSITQLHILLEVSPEENFIQNYKESCIFSLKQYINKPKTYIINELLKGCSTWDNYNLSMIYIMLLYNYKKEHEYVVNSKFINAFLQILIQNINPIATNRCSAEHTSELFDNALQTIDSCEFV